MIYTNSPGIYWIAIYCFSAFHLQGHTEVVHSVCWDAKGDYLASVSHDSVRVWSLASGGECIHELIFNGNNFQSCVFHPSYSTLLVIGGDQVILNQFLRYDYNDRKLISTVKISFDSYHLGEQSEKAKTLGLLLSLGLVNGLEGVAGAILQEIVLIATRCLILCSLLLLGRAYIRDLT